MENAHPETPTKSNGEETTNGVAPPSPGASAGGSGGLRRRWSRRNGSATNASPKNLRWSDNSGAAGRDAYTAELLRAKTQRNLMRDVSQKKIRVQFAVPPPTLPEMTEGEDEKADGGRPTLEVPLSSVAQYLSSRRLSDNSGDIGINEEAHIPFGSRANASAYDHSQHGTSHVEHRRTNIDAQSANVLALLEQLGESTRNIDDDGDGLHHGLDDGHGDGHHSGRIPFYAYPRQRQKWGEAQILPHINWGDLFFDLFYVAAAYNLGTLLMSTLIPSLYDRGIVYFIGVFGPLYNCWESKLFYESRYSVGDYAHQILEVIRVFFLSFSVLHIKSIDLMSDPKSAEMFGFTLGIFIESLIRIILKIELILVGQGDQEAIRNHSRRKIKVTYLPQTLFFLAAVVVSGVQLWDENHPEGGKKRYLATSDTSSDAWSLADVPIVLCLAAYVYHLLYHASKTLTVARMKDFRTGNVPSNIDFMIHRYGEWTMLMLGEAVLSLLIVDTTESTTYYVVAGVGVLTVILLQAVKFESEPSHAEGHALWRNLNWGVVYAMLVQLLSMGLIAFGVSYKVMLKSIHKESEKKANYGSDYGSDYGESNSAYGESKESGGYETGDKAGAGEDDYAGSYPESRHRFLAPSVSTTDLASAALFSGALTIVLIALECMTNSHINTHDSLSHFLHPGQWIREAGGKVKFALFLFKVGLILLTATLSLWLTEPNQVVIAGFFIVAAFAIARIVWWNYIHYTFDGKEQDTESGKSRNSSTHSIYAVDPKISQSRNSSNHSGSIYAVDPKPPDAEEKV